MERKHDSSIDHHQPSSSPGRRRRSDAATASQPSDDQSKKQEQAGDDLFSNVDIPRGTRSTRNRAAARRYHQQPADNLSPGIDIPLANRTPAAGNQTATELHNQDAGTSGDDDDDDDDDDADLSESSDNITASGHLRYMRNEFPAELRAHIPARPQRYRDMKEIIGVPKREEDHANVKGSGRDRPKRSRRSKKPAGKSGAEPEPEPEPAAAENSTTLEKKQDEADKLKDHEDGFGYF